MNRKNGKAKRQAGGLARHGGGHLQLAPSCHGAEWGATNDPTVIIIPQKGANCQERTVSETRDLLTLADDVLEKHNAARARYIAGGDPADFRAAVALADDRRALLQQIGGETW